jgi:hypothetical protein
VPPTTEATIIAVFEELDSASLQLRLSDETTLLFKQQLHVMARVIAFCSQQLQSPMAAEHPTHKLSFIYKVVSLQERQEGRSAPSFTQELQPAMVEQGRQESPSLLKKCPLEQDRQTPLLLHDVQLDIFC